MMSSAIDRLAEALRVLPGVGPKTAQRMVLHLLERDRDGGKRLASRLSEAMDRVGQC
ncbi:MAG: recombination protein RecR, partial [Gammaproteobacteria bacterium]|nr:recombination protein RecR [Gammaproteobacteria bacterium]